MKIASQLITQVSFPLAFTASFTSATAQDAFTPLVLDETLVTDSRIFEEEQSEVINSNQVTAYRTDTPVSYTHLTLPTILLV